MCEPEPWPSRLATENIRSIARDGASNLEYTTEVKDKIEHRGFQQIMGDLKYVLKNGFVHGTPKRYKASRKYVYSIESMTPNSGGRRIRLGVIPSVKANKMKVVWVEWVDDSPSGSLAET